LHTCVRCGREATSLEEIHNGCPCGAKVFVFNKDAEKEISQPAQVPAAQPEAKGTGSESQAGEIVFPQQDGAKAGNGKNDEGNGADGKAPESSFARTTFSTEDVENIKIVSEGVFFVDVNALSKNPVVLKDEEGVYYVRLPLSQSVLDEGGGKSEGNGKKAVAEEKKAVEPKAK
jgi:predicted  nucleic acid-binding Zn-ribbon protein